MRNSKPDYMIRYWFEWKAGCFWSANDATRERFGSLIPPEKLPLGRSGRPILDIPARTFPDQEITRPGACASDLRIYLNAKQRARFFRINFRFYQYPLTP